MKLTPAERAILHNQLQILSLLDPEDTEWYRSAQEILANGYASRYGDVTRVIADAELPRSECELVTSAMQMYWVVQMAAKAAGEDLERFAFPGFDGNDETSHMSYARFVYAEKNRFDDLVLESEGLNSHRPMAAKYRAMEPVFSALMNRLGGNRQMTLAEIEELLNTR